MYQNLCLCPNVQRSKDFQKVRSFCFADAENKVKKILKLAKGINGNKEGNLKKEIIHLVEDFHQHYESLYSLYEDLREEAKNNINGRDDGSSTPSDSEEFYSPVDFMHKNSMETSSSEIVHVLRSDDETSDVEDTILKDKLTSSSEVKETSFGSQSQDMNNFFKDLRVQIEEPNMTHHKSAQVKDLEREVARLKFEIETLCSQKLQWEQQVECKANEAMQMKERISRLQGRVLELESTCKEKECLQLQVEALSHERDELEQRLSSEAKERTNEVKGLVEQVDCLHQELVSANIQKAELELELNKNLKNQSLIDQGRIGGKESSKSQVNDFHSKDGRKSNLQEQIAKTSQESNQSVDEKQELLRKMSQLQTSLLISERKLSSQEKKVKLSEDEFSAQIKSLNQKIKNHEKNLEALHKEKTSLKVEFEALRNEKEKHTIELEKEKRELLLIKSKMERKNTELTTKIADQQKTLLELGDLVHKLKTDNIKSHPNFQLVEKKIEEMAEEFRKQFEDKYRTLSRRIRAAEKLHVDHKEWFLNTNEAYKQENKSEQEKIEEGLRNIKDMSVTANDVLISLDSIVLKVDECNENFLNRISKTSCEVNYAKDWVRRKNNALLQVKHDLDDLLCQLDDKEAEILVFRERVWKLENKLRDTETKIKEKDEGVKELREEKREAIRQLCVWIDYHRCKTDYYKKMMKRMSEINQRRQRGKKAS
ncbi:hypothetical protein C2S51_029951 [Perilla frutescens var. frutescens]|nr:hypothetical protein C2S51_029951 [Perilla frutescens var. frutescens]